MILFFPSLSDSNKENFVSYNQLINMFELNSSLGRSLSTEVWHLTLLSTFYASFIRQTYKNLENSLKKYEQYIFLNTKNRTLLRIRLKAL